MKFQTLFTLIFVATACNQMDKKQNFLYCNKPIGAANRPYATIHITTEGVKCPVNQNDYPDEILILQ